MVVPTQPPLGPLTATTTEQEDIIHAGQRRINLIWETTQSVIAVSVVVSNMVVAVYQGLSKQATLGEFPIVLSSSLFLVIGFYFARTNHTATGGVGPKSRSTDTYQGR